MNSSDMTIFRFGMHIKSQAIDGDQVMFEGLNRSSYR